MPEKRRSANTLCMSMMLIIIFYQMHNIETMNVEFCILTQILLMLKVKEYQTCAGLYTVPSIWLQQKCCVLRPP